MLLALVVGLLYLRKNNLDFLYNKTTWALGALVSGVPAFKLLHLGFFLVFLFMFDILFSLQCFDDLYTLAMVLNILLVSDQ